MKRMAEITIAQQEILNTEWIEGGLSHWEGNECLVRAYLCLTPTLWTVAGQAPLSVGFLRQENWSGLPFPPPGDHPNPRIEPTSPVSPALQADSLPTEPLGKLSG